METTSHPLTLTVEQAAKVLGISRSTAYELVHTGEIPSLRLGRRIVVPIGQLAVQLGIPVEQVQGCYAEPSPRAPSVPPRGSVVVDRSPRRERPERPTPTLF